jgi:uncharacterized protein YacL (UPF0231 family)
MTVVSNELNEEQMRALNELKEALQFYDEVKNASRGAQNAVGADHTDWINRASRQVVKAFGYEPI